MCPLDRVLTYKNLIYLLNLQFYCVNTSCSEVGEERNEFTPIRNRNKPPEGSTSQFSCFFCYVQVFTYVQIFTSVQQISSISAEQPLQVPGGRALNQPRPHPSGKIV